MSATLKKSTQDIVNPTGRMDIGSGLVIYEAQVSEDLFHYRLTIRNWATLIGRLKGREQLALDFRVDNGPKVRVSLGRASDTLKRAGEIRGSASFGDGVDPLAVSVTIIVSDPADSHRIVARGVKAKPDVIVDDLATDLPEDSSKVRPLRDTHSEALSIMDLRVSPKARGKFSVELDNVEVPTLLLNPSFGKKQFLADIRLVCLVLEAAVRDILTAMAFQPEEYEGQPWFSKWKDFATTLSETGEWEHFVDEDIDFRERRSRVEDAVAVFDDRKFSQVAFDAPSSDFQEE